MKNRRRMLMSVQGIKNLLRNATVKSGNIIVGSTGTTATLAGTVPENKVFIIPVLPNKTYQLIKTRELGQYFRVAYSNTENLINNMTLYSYIGADNQKEIITTSPNDAVYMIITGYRAASDGDVSEQLKLILKVWEV